MKIILTLVKTTTLLVFGSIMVLTIGAYLNLPLPLKPLVVKTGSMEPAIDAGSLVFVTKKPVNEAGVNYVEGDVITFKSGSELVSHRVIRVDRSTGEKMFKTKGDANKHVDSTLVAESAIVGKVNLSIPYVGRFVEFVKQPQGFFLLIVIPTLLIIVSEMVAIWEELKKRPVKSGKLDFAKPFAMFFMAAIFLNTSHAFFTDVATSTNNTFTTAESFGVPIANHLVINEVLYDTSAAQNINGQGGSNRGEWVEIYNPTDSSVNVNGWVVADNTSTETLPNISIPSKGFLIITGATESEFRAVWTSVPTVNVLFFQASGGTIGNGLANGGDRLIMKNNLENVIDMMSYGTDTTGFVSGCTLTCPTVSSGHSLERKPAGVDTNFAGDFINQSLPTPGVGLTL